MLLFDDVLLSSKIYAQAGKIKLIRKETGTSDASYPLPVLSARHGRHRIAPGQSREWQHIGVPSRDLVRHKHCPYPP